MHGAFIRGHKSQKRTKDRRVLYRLRNTLFPAEKTREKHADDNRPLAPVRENERELRIVRPVSGRTVHLK